MATRENTLVLFDIDGTLTVPMKEATTEMLDYLKGLRKKVHIGVVGGSNIAKARKQLGDDMTSNFDYCFPENGLLAYQGETEISKTEFKDYLTPKQYNELASFILKYIAELDIPVKRGTFIEFRTGMINVSPIGRNCSYEERIAFNKYDQEHKIRETMVKILQEKFADFNLKFSIGGMISFDVFPMGWDKTYCLRHVAAKNFQTIHFFGDKTHPGGNDHEIFIDERTQGHHVDGPEDTLRILKSLFD